jgi:hypothetical protein
MSETLPMKIAVGDEVRVHFHPSAPWKSFSEGVVRRVDVTTEAGRFFVLEVAHEVILDREHRIRPKFQDYVSYECQNDFPGRIERLSAKAQDVEREPAPDLMVVEPSEEAEQEADEQHRVELEVYSETEIAQASETAANFEPTQVDVEPQPAREPRGLMAALFGRKR